MMVVGVVLFELKFYGDLMFIVLMVLVIRDFQDVYYD